jgi:hypothetical protein
LWLIQRGNPGAAISYPPAINQISEHYSRETGTPTNIYQLTDQTLISAIAHDYRLGRFVAYGREQGGRYRAAIGRYSEFFLHHDNPEGQELPEEQDTLAGNSFAYENDLQTSLCAQISELFPEYKIFGNNSMGIEYSVGGKRIDVLLESKDGEGLLAIELKSGIADYKVFGQIAMYIGLLKDQFPQKKISGVIVAGKIDPSLKLACSITDRIALKVYRMSIELDEV